MFALPTLETPAEVPLDFLAFLSARLGMDEEPALTALGSFLVEFESSQRAHMSPGASQAG